MASSINSMTPDRIIDLMTKSLPSRDTIKTVKDAYAAVALLCHACMLAAGFRLVGLGEDHRIEADSESSDVHALPSEWDASSTYAFRYRHSQSSMEYLLKVTRLGTKAIIYGLGVGDDRTASFEIKVQDYTSEGSLQDSSSNEDTKTKLRNILISNGRISDLTNKFKTDVIQKLAPGIQKEGYEESQTQSQSQSSQQTRQPPLRPEAAPDHNPSRDPLPQPARPHPFDDPLAIPRRTGPIPDFAPPGFEDEFEMNRQPGRGMFPVGGGGQPFGNIGERDLYPPGLGPHDPLRMGPGGIRGGGGGGGMHPTFDDPLFGGQGGNNGQYDPRAPPGARYDPVGPGDGPPNLRGGSRFPGSRGGGPPNPFGGFGSGDFI